MNFYKQSFEDLELEYENSKLWIYLNRPEASNAFSDKMIENLCLVLKHADEDNSVRVIILSGRGKHFCAGGDVKSMKNKSGMFAGEPNELRERYQRGIQNIPRTIHSLSTPLIAMVNGAAIGAGCDLTCMCDLAYGNEYAKFGETFNRLGLIPGDGGTYFLPRVVGERTAKEMLFTGQIYSASDSKEMGLLNNIFSQESLKSEVDKIASQIVSHPPIAIQMTKKALKHSRSGTLDSQLDLLASYQGITQRTQDHFMAIDNLLENKLNTFNHV